MKRDVPPMAFSGSAHEAGPASIASVGGHSGLQDPSPAELLKIAFYGNSEEWSRLHAWCEDGNNAQRLINVLAGAPARIQEQAVNWMDAVREMHPTLAVSRGAALIEPCVHHNPAGGSWPRGATDSKVKVTAGSSGGIGRFFRAAGAFFRGDARRRGNAPGLFYRTIR